MDTVSYSEFSLGLHNESVSRRLPLGGSIEVTQRCNLACSHCYNNLPMDDREVRDGELTLEEHRRIVDEICDAGCLWLLYTGGEIFARRDFLDIYTHAKRRGLLITLFTNGTLITPRVADTLVDWRPFSIEITLYGRTKETYERLTTVPGSYERCMRAIELLMERGLPLQLKTVAVTLNRHEIWDLQRFAAELGVGFKFDGMMNPRTDCSQSPLAVRLTPAEVVQLDLLDPARVAGWKDFAERYKEPSREVAQSDEVYHCGGGINSFAVNPQGKLSLCVLSQLDAFDLRRGSFREGWDGFLYKVRHRKITRMTKCVKCEIKAMCGMCSANGELEHGDPESPVDFLCHVAHLRSYSLGFEVPPHGDCEFCESGSQYPDLMRSAALLENSESPSLKEFDDGRHIPPVLGREQNIAVLSCSTGGCSSCGPAASAPSPQADLGVDVPEPAILE